MPERTEPNAPAGPRVLIPVATGLALRNVLRTGLPNAFRAHGLSPVYAVPDALYGTLASEVEAGRIEADRLPAYNPSRSETVLRDWAMDIVMRHHEIATMQIKKQWQASKRPRRPLKEVVSPVFGRSWAAYRALNSLRDALNPCAEMAPVLERWRPAVVFANNVFDPLEGAVLRRARAEGFATAGMVHSWDNPTNKGVLPAVTDRLLVWGDVMREEMTTYFGVPDERIEKVGSPQFDVYAQEIGTTREELLRHFDFAPSTRIVMYGSSAPGHCKWEPDYAATLAEAAASIMASGGAPIGLVVRLHPRDYAHRYDEVAKHDFVRVEQAGRRDESVADRWSPTEGDHLHFAALMRYAHVVANQFSTVALDAAANDRPTIHVRYDMEPGLPFLQSVERLFGYTHTQRLLACEASYVVRSPAEMEPALRRALDHPVELRDARTELARQEGYDGEGKSAEKIAAAVAALAR